MMRAYPKAVTDQYTTQTHYLNSIKPIGASAEVSPPSHSYDEWRPDYPVMHRDVIKHRWSYPPTLYAAVGEFSLKGSVSIARTLNVSYRFKPSQTAYGMGPIGDL